MERWFDDVTANVYAPRPSVYFNTPQWRAGDIRCEPLRKANNPAVTESRDRQPASSGGAHQLQKAAAHIAAAPDEYLITADVPGFDLSDLTVTITGRAVRIDGQTKCERDTNNWQLDSLCVERQVNKITQLPSGLIIDQANTRASLDKGVLYVTVPVQPRDDSAPEQYRVVVSEGRPDLSVYQRMMQREDEGPVMPVSASGAAEAKAGDNQGRGVEPDNSDGVTVESVPEPTVA